MIPKSAANFSAICLVMQSKYKQNSVRVCVCVCARMVCELAWVRGVAQGWIGRAGQGKGKNGLGWAGQGRLSWCWDRRAVKYTLENWMAYVHIYVCPGVLHMSLCGKTNTSHVKANQAMSAAAAAVAAHLFSSSDPSGNSARKSQHTWAQGSVVWGAGCGVYTGMRRHWVGCRARYSSLCPCLLFCL